MKKVLSAVFFVFVMANILYSQVDKLVVEQIDSNVYVIGTGTLNKMGKLNMSWDEQSYSADSLTNLLMNLIEANEEKHRLLDLASAQQVIDNLYPAIDTVLMQKSFGGQSFITRQTIKYIEKFTGIYAFSVEGTTFIELKPNGSVTELIYNESTDTMDGKENGITGNWRALNENVMILPGVFSEDIVPANTRFSRLSDNKTFFSRSSSLVLVKLE